MIKGGAAFTNIDTIAWIIHINLYVYLRLYN